MAGRKEQNDMDTRKRLTFGTAGIRTTMGKEPRELNERTVKQLAKAYVWHLWAKYGFDNQNFQVVVAHDTRRNSEEFAQIFLDVLKKKDVCYKELKGNTPTPLLANYLHRCYESVSPTHPVVGIIITASHNPKEYNGIKFFGEDGVQISNGEEKEIEWFLKHATPKTTTQETHNYVSAVQQNIFALSDTEYGRNIFTHQKPKNENIKNNYQLYFSPLNGTASDAMWSLSSSMKIEMQWISGQIAPDPNFEQSPVLDPNNRLAYTAMIDHMRKTQTAPIAIGFVMDPDADRLGMMVRRIPEGFAPNEIEFEETLDFYSPNDMAAMYLSWKLQDLKENNKDPQDYYAICSFVSGQLPQTIAINSGLEFVNTDVGWKNISNCIVNIREMLDKRNDDDPCNFLFAWEESGGFLLSNEIHMEKDALQMFVAMLDVIGNLGYEVMKKGRDHILNLLENGTNTKHEFVEDTVSVPFTPSNIAHMINMINETTKKCTYYDFNHIDKYNTDLHTWKDTTDSDDIAPWVLNMYVRPSGTEKNKTKVYLQGKVETLDNPDHKKHLEKVQEISQKILAYLWQESKLQKPEMTLDWAVKYEFAKTEEDKDAS